MDQNLSLFTQISKDLWDEYKVDEPFQPANPFAWMGGCSPGRKGAIGKKMVSRWLRERGFHVTSAPSSDREADRLINNCPTKIKFSRLWAKGFYKFQQLRDEDYQFMICLGISPSSVHCWALPKDLIMEKWKDGKEIKSQHGGGSEGSDAWFTVDPRHPPAWISKYGGRPADALSVIEDLVGRGSQS